MKYMVIIGLLNESKLSSMLSKHKEIMKERSTTQLTGLIETSLNNNSKWKNKKLNHHLKRNRRRLFSNLNRIR